MCVHCIRTKQKSYWAFSCFCLTAPSTKAHPTLLLYEEVQHHSKVFCLRPWFLQVTSSKIKTLTMTFKQPFQLVHRYSVRVLVMCTKPRVVSCTCNAQTSRDERQMSAPLTVQMESYIRGMGDVA